MTTRTELFVNGVTKAALIALTVIWLLTDFGWTLSAGCLAISGLWFARTWVLADQLLAGFATGLNRLFTVVPVWLGVAFAVLAWFNAPSIGWNVLAALSLVGWLWLYVRYQLAKRNYVKQKGGLLPKNVVTNVSIEYLRPGDLLLTSGDMAEKMGDPVGHLEQVVYTGNGLGSLTCRMAEGLVVSAVERITKAYSKPGRHYVVLRPAKPLTAEQEQMLYTVPKVMEEQNREYREKTSADMKKLVNRLWLPARFKAALKKKIDARVTGYDWFGLISGRRATDHWTCIGACIESMTRIGIPLRPYGVGFFGLGTGFLDPFTPSRLLRDPNLRALTEEDLAEMDREMDAAAAVMSQEG